MVLPEENHLEQRHMTPIDPIRQDLNKPFGMTQLAGSNE